MLLVVAWSVFLVLVWFTLYCRYCYYGRKLAEIPGPRRWPLIGNAVEAAFLNPETSFTFARSCRKYGPISRLTSLLVAVVNISDPGYVEQLFSSYRYNEKRTPYNFMRGWLCEGLLVSNGEKWKHRRKLLTPAFHFTVLKSFCSTFYDHTTRFLQRIDLETEKDRTDITPLISRTTLNVMCVRFLQRIDQETQKDRTDITPLISRTTLNVMCGKKSFCSTFHKHTTRFLHRIDQETQKDRTDITPLISRTTLNVMCGKKSFCSTFHEHTTRFLQRIDQETQKDRTDITPLISRTTLNVMCGKKSFCSTFHEQLDRFLFLQLIDQETEKDRTDITPLISRTTLNVMYGKKSFCSTFHNHTTRFLQLIDKETGKDRTDITPLISRITLNVMCETSMGTSVNTKDSQSTIDKYFKSILIFGGIIQRRIVTVWLHFDWVHKLLPLAKQEKKLVADMHALTNKVIQDRRNLREDDYFNSNMDEDAADAASKKPRLAMLDHLLELEKEGLIDKDGIREEVDTFMFEGHDTTSAALSFMIMRLANETKVQDQIYKELHRIFGDSERAPTIDDFNEMRYLDCCIKESLRLYPPVPLIARYISEDIHLGKYTVPQGAVTFIHVYDIHHDPAIYPDPEKFDPDRFLLDNVAKRHPFAYIPFSAGPRNCIGQKFAMYEMKTLISSLLRRYRLEAVTRPQDITFIADLVLRSKNPLYVKIRRR
ncbi:cytochrome p450 domain-containing protein [Phthorimaea operculella]|nr:cytochrome p450 domain-containing protein [Phthorimaea operculella]